MKCCLCGKEIEKKYNEQGIMYWDEGENAQPVAKGRCCSECNWTKVIPARLANIGGSE